MIAPWKNLKRLVKVDHNGNRRVVEDARPLETRHIYTDGSSKQRQGGWAAIVYPEPPVHPVSPDWVLYGPVTTQAWNPNYLEAESGSISCAELTAIGKACVWLMERVRRWGGMGYHARPSFTII